MVTIKSELIRPFDVDGTIIIHGSDHHCKTKVNIYDPIENRTITAGVNEPMVRLLKEEAARGGYIIVWSRGGYAWARAVVEALGLTREVSLVMSKPMVYFDDMNVEHWLKDRVFLGPDINYKK